MVGAGAGQNAGSIPYNRRPTVSTSSSSTPTAEIGAAGNHKGRSIRSDVEVPEAGAICEPVAAKNPREIRQVVVHLTAHVEPFSAKTLGISACQPRAAHTPDAAMAECFLGNVGDPAGSSF